MKKSMLLKMHPGQELDHKRLLLLAQLLGNTLLAMMAGMKAEPLSIAQRLAAAGLSALAAAEKGMAMLSLSSWLRRSKPTVR